MRCIACGVWSFRLSAQFEARTRYYGHCPRTTAVFLQTSQCLSLLFSLLQYIASFINITNRQTRNSFARLVFALRVEERTSCWAPTSSGHFDLEDNVGISSGYMTCIILHVLISYRVWHSCYGQCV